MCVGILQKQPCVSNVFLISVRAIGSFPPGKQQDFLCLLFCLLKSGLDLYHSSHTTVPIYSFCKHGVRLVVGVCVGMSVNGNI